MTGSRIEPGPDSAMRALNELLDAYGADPARWPAEDPRRPAAWALIDSGDAAALQSLAAAGALDRVLERVTPPAPSAALTGAILQAAQRTGPDIRAWTGLFRNPALLKPALLKPALLKPVAALACAMFLGVMVGIWSPVPVAGVGESRAAGLETEMASLGTLDGNGDDNGFGDLAR